MERYEKAAHSLLEEFSAEDLAAAFLKSMIKDSTEIPVKITPERPLPNKSHKGGGGGKGRPRSKGKTYGDRRGAKRPDSRRGSSSSRGGEKRYNSSDKRQSGSTDKKSSDRRGSGNSKRDFTIRQK